MADHTYHCLQCGAHGNALEPWASTSHLHVYEAAVDLYQRLGRPLPAKTAPHAATKRNRKEETVVGSAANTTLTLNE